MENSNEEYDYSNYRVYEYNGITVTFIVLPGFDKISMTGIEPPVNNKRIKRQYNGRRNKK